LTAASRGEALSRLARVVDMRTGIVRKVELPRLGAGDAPVRVAESHPARLVGGEAEAVNEGGGASLDGEVAELKAIGESIERYCAAFPQGASEPIAHRELEGEAIPPQAFSLFSEDQHREPGFRLRSFEPRTPVSWVRGQGLSDGRPLWVPAAFVHLPHRPRPGEAAITTSISTGLAAGPDRRAAAASALCEVVERDAFMLTWRHRLPTPLLDLDGLGRSPEALLVDALRATGMRCRARLLNQDVPIPVIAVVLQGEAPVQPAAVVGAGCAPQPRRALRLALEEACLSLFGINRLRRRLRGQVLGLAAEELRSLTLQSTAFAVRPELAAAAPFFFGEGAATVSLARLEARFASLACGSLGSLVAALGSFRRHAALVDCTTADVRDVGVSVVRVVVPEMRPLDHDAGAPHLGGRRWLDHPVDPGPHPFP